MAGGGPVAEGASSDGGAACEGDVTGAQRIMQQEFMSERLTRSHQTLFTVGTRWIDDGVEMTDYRRSLDLATGVTETTFGMNGHSYRCRMFASEADDVIVVRWETSHNACLYYINSTTHLKIRDLFCFVIFLDFRTVCDHHRRDLEFTFLDQCFLSESTF